MFCEENSILIYFVSQEVNFFPIFFLITSKLILSGWQPATCETSGVCVRLCVSLGSRSCRLNEKETTARGVITGSSLRRPLSGVFALAN